MCSAVCGVHVRSALQQIGDVEQMQLPEILTDTGIAQGRVGRGAFLHSRGVPGGAPLVLVRRRGTASAGRRCCCSPGARLTSWQQTISCELKCTKNAGCTTAGQASSTATPMCEMGRCSMPSRRCITLRRTNTDRNEGHVLGSVKALHPDAPIPPDRRRRCSPRW